MRLNLALMILMPWLGGCAFVDLNIKPPNLGVFSDAPNLGRGREVVVDQAFADRRGFPARCGMQKNGYNVDTADVHCAIPPTEWIPGALERGLTAANFRVLRPGDRIGPNVVRLQGAVFQFFVEPDIGPLTTIPEADIGVNLIVTSTSGLHAERVFYAKGYDVALIATESNFQSASEDATVRVVRLMVEHLSKLMDRYPQLGKPGESSAQSIASPSTMEKPQ